MLRPEKKGSRVCSTCELMFQAEGIASSNANMEGILKYSENKKKVRWLESTESGGRRFQTSLKC